MEYYQAIRRITNNLLYPSIFVHNQMQKFSLDID